MYSIDLQAPLDDDTHALALPPTTSTPAAAADAVLAAEVRRTQVGHKLRHASCRSCSALARAPRRQLTRARAQTRFVQHAEAVAAYIPRRAPIGCKHDSGEAVIHSIRPDGVPSEETSSESDVSPVSDEFADDVPDLDDSLMGMDDSDLPPGTPGGSGAWPH